MGEAGATEIGPTEYPSVPGLGVELARSVLRSPSTGRTGAMPSTTP